MGLERTRNRKERIPTSVPVVPSPETEKQRGLEQKARQHEQALGEIRRAASFERGVRFAQPERIAAAREKWLTQGVVTSEEMGELAEIKLAAAHSLSWELWEGKEQPADIHAYLKERDRWVRSGLLTAEEANQSEAVRKVAKTSLYEEAISYISSDTHLARRKQEWVESGIFTDKECDELIGRGKITRRESFNDEGI